MMSRRQVYLIAISIAARIGFFLFGLYQDEYMTVKYTDIDYVVFSDAARYVYQGQSPYARETYRYTPLLAWMLVPNEWWPHFGKFVFMVSDVVTGVIITSLLGRLPGIDEVKSLTLSAIWLLNPMVITISTRGSSESVLTVIVMLSVYYLARGNMSLSAVFLGLAIHFKIYPVIYLPSILLYLGSVNSQPILDWPIVRLINWKNIRYLVVTVASLSALNLIMYHAYGYEFLYHSYLYHLGRLDHRHNFSVYNISLYYKSAQPYLPQNQLNWVFANLEKLAFIPQLLISAILLPIAFASSNLVGCLFLQTFAFVLFNKVMTSQYFIWFLIFLPQFLARSSLISLKGAGLLALWVVGQGLWLLNAYNLEFLGHSTFDQGLLWASSFFYLANCFLLGEFIDDMHKQ